MNPILPKAANNIYLGKKSAYYFFIFFMVINTTRSFIHLLAEDAGLNSIANIILFEGSPDPNKVIYALGSMWGLMQILCCLISWIVIFRYKSLISFMYVIWLLEWILRLFVVGALHPLGPVYQDGVTPGVVTAPYIALLLLIFFVLSLLKSK